MIELRSLAYFTVACQHESLARAAEQLGIGLSTLSSSLKTLEKELGLELFQRLSSGLCPTAAASWLLRAAIPVLHAEAYGRRRLATPGIGEAHLVTVEMDLSFTIGRLTKAIDRAAATLSRQAPEVLIEPQWVAEKGFVRPLAEFWPGLRQSRIKVQAIDSHAEVRAEDMTLLCDPWVLACRLPAMTAHPPSAAELMSGRLLVPALRRHLLEQASEYFATCGFRNVQFMTEHPAALPRYISERPDAAFFLPESLLSARLGLLRVRAIAPQPALSTRIIAHSENSDPVVVNVMQHLRDALKDPERISAHAPLLSNRQIRSFNAIYRLRRVSAAAKAAGMTQPALSEQLQKLESSLAHPLFERRRDGLDPTERGDLFAPVARLIEASLREICGAQASSFPTLEKRLMLGILPSVSQHGLLVNKIAEVLLGMRASHPALQIVVWEAPDLVLQEWVMRGAVGIAIVDTGLPHMARLSLGSSEPLAVIADPRHRLLPGGAVPLNMLSLLPLVLPSRRSGLRQLLERAAGDSGVSLQPKLEIDSLSMLVALLGAEPSCTVLPPSAVRRELAAGELVAYPLIEPQISRRLFAIYSAERSLTEAERHLVQLLRERLGELPCGAPPAADTDESIEAQ